MKLKQALDSVLASVNEEWYSRFTYLEFKSKNGDKVLITKDMIEEDTWGIASIARPEMQSVVKELFTKFKQQRIQK